NKNITDILKKLNISWLKKFWNNFYKVYIAEVKKCIHSHSEYRLVRFFKGWDNSYFLLLKEIRRELKRFTENVNKWISEENVTLMEEISELKNKKNVEGVSEERSQVLSEILRKKEEFLKNLSCLKGALTNSKSDEKREKALEDLAEKTDLEKL